MERKINKESLFGRNEDDMYSTHKPQKEDIGSGFIILLFVASVLCLIGGVWYYVTKVSSNKVKEPRTLEQYASEQGFDQNAAPPAGKYLVASTSTSSGPVLPTQASGAKVGDQCVPGSTMTCGSNIGSCEYGLQTCNADGTWGVCASAVYPTAEICDGLDNDCNGIVDDGVGCQCLPGSIRVCGSNVGECRSGRQTCGADGVWASVCTGAKSPRPEVCDGLDNNCDGVIDEGCPSERRPQDLRRNWITQPDAGTSPKDEPSHRLHPPVFSPRFSPPRHSTPHFFPHR